jgi:hypothetical protein
MSNVVGKVVSRARWITHEVIGKNGQTKELEE